MRHDKPGNRNSLSRQPNLAGNLPAERCSRRAMVTGVSAVVAPPLATTKPAYRSENRVRIVAEKSPGSDLTTLAACTVSLAAVRRFGPAIS